MNLHKNLLGAILASLRLFIRATKDQVHHYIQNYINLKNLTPETKLQLLALVCNGHLRNKQLFLSRNSSHTVNPEVPPSWSSFLNPATTQSKDCPSSSLKEDCRYFSVAKATVQDERFGGSFGKGKNWIKQWSRKLEFWHQVWDNAMVFNSVYYCKEKEIKCKGVYCISGLTI